MKFMDMLTIIPNLMRKNGCDFDKAYEIYEKYTKEHGPTPDQIEELLEKGKDLQLDPTDKRPIGIKIPRITDKAEQKRRAEIRDGAHKIIKEYTRKFLEHGQSEHEQVPRAVNPFLKVENTPEDAAYNQFLYDNLAENGRTTRNDRRQALTKLLFEISEINVSDYTQDFSDEELVKFYSDPEKEKILTLASQIGALTQISKHCGVDQKLIEHCDDIYNKLIGPVSEHTNRLELMDTPYYDICDPADFYQDPGFSTMDDSEYIKEVMGEDSPLVKNDLKGKTIYALQETTIRDYCNFGAINALAPRIVPMAKECGYLDQNASIAKAYSTIFCDTLIPAGALRSLPGNKPIIDTYMLGTYLMSGKPVILKNKTEDGPDYILRMDHEFHIFYNECPNFVPDPGERPAEPQPPAPRPEKPTFFMRLLNWCAGLIGMNYAPYAARLDAITKWEENHTAREEQYRQAHEEWTAASEAYDRAYEEFITTEKSGEDLTRLMEESANLEISSYSKELLDLRTTQTTFDAEDRKRVEEDLKTPIPYDLSDVKALLNRGVDQSLKEPKNSVDEMRETLVKYVVSKLIAASIDSKKTELSPEQLLDPDQLAATGRKVLSSDAFRSVTEGMDADGYRNLLASKNEKGRMQLYEKYLAAHLKSMEAKKEKSAEKEQTAAKDVQKKEDVKQAGIR